MIKQLPINTNIIKKACNTHPTPFYLYDELSMVNNAKKFLSAFSWSPQFTNYFAVKATPTPKILQPLCDIGMGLDCSSYTELLIAERMGITGERIMFTSNNTPAIDMKKARELNALINLDDITHIDFLHELCGIPDLISFRYNPGPLKKGNAIIGNPEEAKYGVTKAQLFEGFKKARSLGATRFALHTMVASNELDETYFVETAQILFQLAVELKETIGIQLESVNLGGGIGIPYKPEQTPVNFDLISRKIQQKYEEIIVPAGLDPLALKMENGRVITGPYGILVSKVLHKKSTYKEYVGLDACMANLMRPGIYGAYHHITILDKTSHDASVVYDVTGGLCENNDKFAIDRTLPPIEIGDIAVIHDVGAHGHSMGFNYNGKLRSAEFLFSTQGEFILARRAEQNEDYLRTIEWSE